MNLLQSMNYEEFLDRVRTMAEHRTGGEAQVTIRPILKNNNLRLDGLLILYPGENISPALYLNQYYARYLGGIPMEMILDEIFATYESCRCPDRFDLDQLRDFDGLGNISVRLISRSLPTKRCFRRVLHSVFGSGGCFFSYHRHRLSRYLDHPGQK